MNSPARCAKRGSATQADATPAQPESHPSEATTTPPPLKKTRQAIIRVKPGQSPAAAMAEIVVAGPASNAATAVAFSKTTYGEVDLTACLTALNESIAAVHDGDLRDAAAILMAQAVALNAMFSDLSQRSAKTLLSARHRRPYDAAGPQSAGAMPRDARDASGHQKPANGLRQAGHIAAGPQQVNNTLSVDHRACSETGLSARGKSRNREKQTIGGASARAVGRWRGGECKRL